jgi:hypothetical protein
LKCKILHALRFAAAKRAYALEFAKQQRILFCKLRTVDFELVHATEQKAGVEETSPRLRHFRVTGALAFTAKTLALEIREDW